MRGFAGCLDHSLDWLERVSPGVGVRFRGNTLKRWQRNTAATYNDFCNSVLHFLREESAEKLGHFLRFGHR
jgi:hypothetical protein